MSMKLDLMQCDSWKKVAWIGGISVGGILLSRRLYASYSFRQNKRRCDHLRSKYQSELATKMEKFRVYLENNPMSEADIELITSMPPDELLQKLQKRELDHKKVLLAFQKKAFQINVKLNCVTEFLYPDFSEINLKGPLAGLPVSFKENFSMKGLVSCAGCSEAIGFPTPTEDCVPVQLIKDLGGVPFCRTNIPQTMMSFQSSNPVFGATRNPFNSTRTSGGSSSGEGALVGAGGSPLGIGTDIGGSIRIPAVFCGIVGLKTTSNRLSRKKMLSFGGQSIIVSSWGPMAANVNICIELMRHLFGSQLHSKLDPFLPPLPFQEQDMEKRRLRIGYYTFDGIFHASPGMVNVVNEVRDALIREGHELVPFEVPWPPKERMMLFLRLISSDGGQNFLRLLRYDQHDPCIAGAVKIAQFGPLMHSLVTWYYSTISRNNDLVAWLSVSRGFPSVYDLWKEAGHLEAFRRDFEESWQAAKFDAVLCPAFGTVAPFLHPTSGSYTGAGSYTSLFNLLHCPAGVVPVRKLRPSDLENFDETYPGHLGMWHSTVKQHHENCVGSALGVQIATLPWKDELCLHVMKQVEKVVKASK